MLAIALFLVSAPAALAHANVVRTEPAANANVEQAPSRVQLWFSERPEVKLTQIQVFDAQRKEVQAGAPTQAADDPLSVVEQLEPGLPQGVYTVSWRTTSAVDGHVTGGAFAFGIGAAPTAADLAALTAATQQPPPSPASVIVRWLEYLAAVGLLGLALFGLLVGEQAGARLYAQRLTRTAGTLAIVLLFASFAALLDQARQSGGGLYAGSLQATLGTSVGQNLLGRVALAALILVLLLARPRSLTVGRASAHRSLGAAAARELPATTAIDPGGVALIAALLAQLLLFALSSHAEAVPNAPELALMNDWLHLTLAGVWIGGLIALAVAVVPVLGGRDKPAADLRPEDYERNQLFGPVVAGFSRVALISAIGLAVTGFYQALVHVGSIDNALATGYGKTLIVKTALFALALLLAGFHRWVLVPALELPAKAAATRARRFLSRTLPLEGLLAVGILAATGLLTSLPPANGGGSPSEQVKTLGDTRVQFEIVPLRVGPNLFQVTLTSKGKPVDDAQKVELVLRMLDMDMGQSVVDLEPKGGGVYSAEASPMSMNGRWQLELLLRLPGQLDQRTAFDYAVKA
ncbi:MAG TPA: copper resistance protein CopC [Chloroflexota bacterium]|nr:copper resistance protein CopC [Chloroflexota bacterium]